MVKNIKKISFVKLLALANVFQIVCIDERRIKEENRTNCIGSHSAKYAVINYRHGVSLDQDQLPALGIFSCDVWAAKYYASFINQYDSHINPAQTSPRLRWTG